MRKIHITCFALLFINLGVFGQAPFLQSLGQFFEQGYGTETLEMAQDIVIDTKGEKLMAGYANRAQKDIAI